MKDRKVVITGLGMVTALGLSVEESWGRALAGESGIRAIQRPEWLASPVRAVGGVSEEDLKVIIHQYPIIGSQGVEKRTLFALWAAGEALEAAGLKNNPSEIGVVFGAGLGVFRLEDDLQWLQPNGVPDWIRFAKEINLIHPESQMRHPYDRATSAIADQFSCTGLQSTVTTACASATQAIGTAYRLIKRGEAEVILCGGADSMIHPVGLIYFVLLGAASVSHDPPQSICKPFDRRRAGLVMGEGAGVVILEEEGHARARGAKIYGELAGYASSMDGWRITAPHPEGAGAARAMEKALQDAGMSPESIDYINAHGTGTKLNDAAETLAIRSVFGPAASELAISSSKPLFGHLLAASGGPEFVLTVLTVERDAIHPTLNLTQPDPKCDLDYVPLQTRRRTVRAALSNSFGFGGENGCLVVKKYSQS
jgi:3-oxoacyl-[acyl-carrier-protein] synthase II